MPPFRKGVSPITLIGSLCGIQKAADWNGGQAGGIASEVFGVFTSGED